MNGKKSAEITLRKSGGDCDMKLVVDYLVDKARFKVAEPRRIRDLIRVA